MRPLPAFLAALFCGLSLCGLATAQTRWVEPGTYSAPFTPRLSTPVASPEVLVTPSLALDNPTPVAGASNGTTSAAIDAGVYVNQPIWYAPGVQFNRPLFLDSTIASAQAQVNFMEAEEARKEQAFESGGAISEMSYGVAQLKSRGPMAKATRVFTNADLARMNDANGTVKYAGKPAIEKPAIGN
jgi:hypothetical protein